MTEQKKKQSPLVLGMGALSALLFLSGIGTLLFLLPLIYSSLRYGRKALYFSSLIAGILISGITLVLTGFNNLALYSILIALVLIISFSVIAFEKPKNFIYRCLLSAVLIIPVAQLVIPAVLNNDTVKSFAVEQINTLLLNNQIELHSEIVYQDAVALLSKISGASFFIFLFLNSWLGGTWFINRRYRNFVNVIIGASEVLKNKARETENNQQTIVEIENKTNEDLIRLAQKISEEHESEDDAIYPYNLKAYHVPQALIWFLIIAWAFILISLKVQIPVLAANLAWNCTITVSFCYLFQGLAVVYTRLSLLPTATAARLGFTIILILLVVGGAVSLIVSIALMLLGTLETWIKLRPIKGE